MSTRQFLSFLVILWSVLVVGANATVRPDPSIGHWVDTWTTMPQLVEPANLPNPPFNETGIVFQNTTIRQTLHMSIGAKQIRIRISNAFGTTDLPITAATVAQTFNNTAGTSKIIPGTSQTLTFSGNSSIIIPNGDLAVTDPINFTIKPQSMISVSLYLANGQTTNFITGHPGSRTTTSYTFGNHVADNDLTDPSKATVLHWYFLTAVEAWAPVTSKAFVIVGDSITDGRASTNDANNRWPDLLLAKMQNNWLTSSIGVDNQAAGGNRILADGLGPNAIGRIERDVIAQAGVGYAMIFEGVNDIGVAPATADAQQVIGDRLIQAFKQIVTRVHTNGIPMFAATITPFSGNVTIQPYSDPVREVTRQRVNQFIRTSGLFDAVIDFDKILRDPANPSQLNPIYNSGDFLHPNVAGYQELANAFPLSIFTQFALGVSSFE